MNLSKIVKKTNHPGRGEEGDFFSLPRNRLPQTEFSGQRRGDFSVGQPLHGGGAVDQGLGEF